MCGTFALTLFKWNYDFICVKIELKSQMLSSPSLAALDIGCDDGFDKVERQNRDIELKPTRTHTYIHTFMHARKQASKQHIEFTFL